MLVFTSFQPFYDGVDIAAFGRLSLENYAVLLGAGLVPRLDREHADPRRLDRDDRRALHGAVRLAGRAAA